MFFCFLTAHTSFGQLGNLCDTIYEKPEKLAQFKNGTDDLMVYTINNLGPILSNYIIEGGNIIESLYIKMTIDLFGKVVEVDFPRLEASQSCKERLKKEILAMENWTPGQVDGKSACTVFVWPIACLKWD
jgi:hypothetical protein